MNHDRNQMAKIDQYTVDMLQLRAPTASRADAKAVKGLIMSGEVFAGFSEPERITIWERMQSSEACDYIIPSLYTFFRDILYLEVCADGVKRLVVPNKKHPTVRSAMNHIFQHNRSGEGCLVQTSETTFRHADAGAERFEFGYRQIWLYAMRHYPGMAKDPISEDVIAKASRGKADKTVLYDMAVLARKLGFYSPQTEELLSHSPDREIAREALLKARKPGYYRYDSIESLIDHIIETCFGAAREKESVTLNEPNVSRPLALNRRCGPPHKQTQLLDRALLFLDQLHSGEAPVRMTVSSLFVRRCVYFAFFGKPSGLGRRQNRVSRSPSGTSPTDIPLSPLFVPDDHSPQGRPLLEQNAGQHRPVEIQRDDRRWRKQARRERYRQRWEPFPRRPQQRRSKQPSEHQPHSFRAEAPAMGVDTDTGSSLRDGASVDEDAAMSNFLINRPLVDKDNAMVDPQRRDVSADQDASMGNSLTDCSPVNEDVATASLFDVVGDIANSDSICENDDDELMPDAEQAHQEPHPNRAEELRTTEIPEHEQPQRKVNESERLQPEAEHRVDAVASEPAIRQNEGSEQGGRERDQSGQTQRTAATSAIVTASQNVTKERAATRRILEGGREEHLLQATDERVAAEHAVQGTLQQLQREADARALDESAAEGFEPVSDVEDRVVAHASEPMPPPNLVDETFSVPTSQGVSVTMDTRDAPADRPQAGPEELPLAPSVTADIMQQDRLMRNARTAKAVTQIDLRGLVGSPPAEQEQESNPGQHERPITSRSRGDKVESRPDANTTVVASQIGDDSKQKKTRNSVTVGVEEPLGEVMVPPLPAHAQPRRILPPNAVTITFRAFERGKWHVVDRIPVDPADPSEAERVAYKYAREENSDARFYNQALRKVSVMQCVRAALNDGTNTVLMSLGMDLTVTRKKVAQVTRMLKADADTAAVDSDDSIL